MFNIRPVCSRVYLALVLTGEEVLSSNWPECTFSWVCWPPMTMSKRSQSVGNRHETSVEFCLQGLLRDCTSLSSATSYMPEMIQEIVLSR